MLTMSTEYTAMQYYWYFMVVTAFTNNLLWQMLLRAINTGLNLGSDFADVVRTVAATVPTVISATWLNWCILRKQRDKVATCWCVVSHTLTLVLNRHDNDSSDAIHAPIQHILVRCSWVEVLLSNGSWRGARRASSLSYLHRFWGCIPMQRCPGSCRASRRSSDVYVLLLWCSAAEAQPYLHVQAKVRCRWPALAILVRHDDI